MKRTYIILTEDMYNELKPLDRKYVRVIEEEKEKIYVANIDVIQQRSRVLSFLREIGGDLRYWRIDEIYVEPLEYEEIKETLKRDRIVFITGTAEYGKTYTAIRLLWEYYCNGYKPVWVRGGEFEERRIVR